MAQQIEWTSQALADYYNIIHYLEESWNTIIADDFMTLTEQRLQTLSQQPFLGIRSEKQTEIRSISLTKYNRLYYKVNEDKLIVLNIFDVRQDPNKNQS
jgi:plasmid stabilization system protein ParE